MQGLVGCLSMIGYVACIIATGVWAWNWIEPHSFWGGLKFMFVWSISGSVASGIWAIICGLLSFLIGDNNRRS